MSNIKHHLRSRWDIPIGIYLFVSSVFGIWYLYGKGHLSNNLMSPGTFPGIILLCIACLGAILSLMALIKEEYLVDTKTIPVKVWRPVLIIIAYTWLFDFTGFIVASIVTIVALMVAMGERDIKIIAATALVSPLVLKLSAEYGLKIVLP